MSGKPYYNNPWVGFVPVQLMTDHGLHRNASCVDAHYAMQTCLALRAQSGHNASADGVLHCQVKEGRGYVRRSMLAAMLTEPSTADAREHSYFSIRRMHASG